MSSMKVSDDFLLSSLLLTAAAAGGPLKYKVVEWLDAPDPSRTHNRLLEEHHEGTGEWFLESQKFELWMETPASILWIKGMRARPCLCCSTDASLIICSVQLEMAKASCGTFHLVNL